MYPVEYCHPKRSHDYLSLSYLLNDETCKQYDLKLYYSQY